MKWKLKGKFFRLFPNISGLKALQNFVLHPSHFRFWGFGTKCWVKTLKVETKHILPLYVIDKVIDCK